MYDYFHILKCIIGHLHVIVRQGVNPVYQIASVMVHHKYISLFETLFRTIVAVYCASSLRRHDGEGADVFCGK